MWCRTILTAVAISYVICMLLWSGLQKDDLDTNTLEKLGRYNVNIDDMNNEQRRQECLLDHITTKVQREALRTSANIESIENGVTVAIYPKIGMLLAGNFEDKTVVNNKVNMNKTKDYIDQLPVVGQKKPDLGNATNVEGNKGIIKIEYNIQNQPDVESVMNFWTKLTRYTTTAVTTLPTTLVAPVTATAQLETQKAKTVTATAQTETHNNGYVHSREMEYISRILAEYLGSQTVPTTTQKISTKKVFPNYVPVKYWELSSKGPVEEITNVNEQSNEINQINNVTQDDFNSAIAFYNSFLDKMKSMPFKVTYNNTQLFRRVQETPSSQIQRKKPKVREIKPVKRNNPTGTLQRLLQMKNELFNNGVLIPEIESRTETIKLFTNKSDEQQDKSELFHLFNIFQNMKDVHRNNVKNYQSTRASIKAETWEPVPLRNKKINKEFKASPIGKTETEQMQIFNTNDNRIEVIPPDIKKWNFRKNSEIEEKESQFQPFLPLMKYSQQNIHSETNNHEVIGMPSVFHKQQQNESTEWFVVKKAIVSQQPAAIENFPRNQLFKMKNDTYKADSGIKNNITQNSKEFNGKEIKKAEVFQNWVPIHDSKKIKALQEEIINNFDRDNQQITLVNEIVSKTTQNFDVSRNMSDLHAIPASVIKEIAEKVKQMVMKDIVEDITTATMGTTSSTNSTTAAPSTIPTTLVTITTSAPNTKPSTLVTTTTSEKPSTSLQTAFTQTNQVMQKLMEIFKELKAMKETTKLTSQLPQNTTTVSNGTARLPQLHRQPYPNVVATFNPYVKQNYPIFKPIQKSSYNPRIVPAPISSAFNPPQNKALQYMPPLNVQPTKDYQFGAITIQTNSDEIAPLAIQIRKPLKLMNQNIVLTTKGPVDKKREERERDSIKHIDEKFRIPNEDRIHRGKLELQYDLPKHFRFAEKQEIRDRYRSGRYLDREKPRYNHEHQEKPVRSRFPELHYPGRLSHLEHVSLPRDLSNENLNHPRGHNRPSLNEPRSHQKVIKHHPGSYGHSEFDRQPRYGATKFHEKLERIENRPRSWKDFQSASDSSNDEISARQQLPLVKVKPRMRYDDSHFTNFLKSQQKVTDMLEKILANNVKNSGPHSYETL